MKLIITILLVFFLACLEAQVSIGTNAHHHDLQVHDSTSTSGILISTGNLPIPGLNLQRRISSEAEIFNAGSSLKLKGGDLTSTGGELILFPGGNVAIGQSILSSDATSELTIGGSNPLKLMGLNESLSSDHMLVTNPEGTVYRRPFSSLFEENSYWFKSGNSLSSHDSIGIGTETPTAPLHVDNSSDLDVIFNTDAQESILHMQSNGIETTIGQYDLSSSKMLLTGTLPAKGLSFFSSRFESISPDQTEGMLLSVDHDRPIYLANAGKERMRIHNDGKIHMGGYSVDYEALLNVQGSTRIKDTLFFENPAFHITELEDTLHLISNKHMRFKTDFIGDYFFDNRDGTFIHFDGSRETLGIGVENAVQELEVDGDVLVYDTLYLGNRFNKLYYGANTYFSTLTNLRLQTSSFYDIEIMSENEEYATFEAESKSLGIGTNTPEEKLDVVGTVKAQQFKMSEAPSEGYVMTSDADGLASWQEIPNDNDWKLVGSDLFTSSPGTVTIGTAGPAESLFNVQGSIALPIIKILVPNYSPSAGDHTIIMDLSPSAVTLPLASSCDGRVYVIKFRGGGSSIQVNAGDQIEGNPTFPVPTSPIGSLYTTIVVQSDGTNGWWIINY